MILSQNDIDNIKKHDSKFISLKYIDLLGNLFQIDTTCSNTPLNWDISLKAIPNKSFRDPFRSYPTTTFFCEELKYAGVRSIVFNGIDKFKLPNIPPLNLEISFWIEDSDLISNQNVQENFLYASDPTDKYSNLRSDIVETLENIDIKCTFHYHGKGLHECIIGIVGQSVVDLADNYIISKFIIENVAENYGKKVSFSNKDYNIKINFMNEQNNSKDLIKNVHLNKNIVLSLFNCNNINDDSLLLASPFNKTNSYIISIKAGNVFNPYIAFTTLILYSLIHNFNISQIFSTDILDKYKTIINFP